MYYYDRMIGTVVKDNIMQIRYQDFSYRLLEMQLSVSKYPIFRYIVGALLSCGYLQEEKVDGSRVARHSQTR